MPSSASALALTRPGADPLAGICHASATVFAPPVSTATDAPDVRSKPSREPRH